MCTNMIERKFPLDESVELRLGFYLKKQGHDVRAIATDYTPGIEDEEVLKIAKNEQRILITNDKDFGELVFRYYHPHAGVLLLRLKRVALHIKQERLTTVLTTHK